MSVQTEMLSGRLPLLDPQALSAPQKKTYDRLNTTWVVWWTPKLGQKLGRLKRESRRLSFPGYAARSLLLDAITFLS